jgi:hypothetical protein
MKVLDRMPHYRWFVQPFVCIEAPYGYGRWVYEVVEWCGEPVLHYFGVEVSVCDEYEDEGCDTCSRLLGEAV